MDLWTQFLNLTSQVVTPIWGDLLQYIPLLLVGLVVVLLVVLAMAWRHQAAGNRSRVPRPMPAGPVPAGVHLPPPSRWPFVIPIGLFFVFAGIIFGGAGTPVNPALLMVGFVVAAIGGVGWFLDAHGEYERLDAADQHLLLVAETAGQPTELHIPAGIHLPGPSAWPFFVPIGLFFVFLGLIFGPILIAAGFVMAAIAAVGWLLDAGHEYRAVEIGHGAEPVNRDPEKAWPKRLVPVYFAVGALAVIFTLTPWVLSFLPRVASVNAGIPAPTSTPSISTSQATRFDQSLVVVKANQPISLTFDNNQAGVPHNVAIYNGPAQTTTFFQGKVVIGPTEIVYQVDPLPPGQYTFLCNVHANMVGSLVSQ